MEECGMDPFGSGRYLWQDIVNIIKKKKPFSFIKGAEFLAMSIH
jgi:hypothetical protein